MASHPPAYLLSRWIFLRLLGSIYLIAFASLAVQVGGLIGANGILPATDYFDRLFDTLGPTAYADYPSLLWFSSSDLTLTTLCAAGVVLSGLLVAGIGPRVVLWMLWVSYLSLTIGGQTFLAFQWDTLLLETGLLACFYAPPGWRPGLATQTPPAPVARWLIWWLLFRLMFLSGVTKLASGDPTWANLTALTYHYQTQPLPLWTAWYVHHLPIWVHQAAAAGMFFVELVLPWLLFAPSRWRQWRLAACSGLVLLQVVIGVTGNYGFFSLLTVALCLTVVDDRAWQRGVFFLRLRQLRHVEPPVSPRLARAGHDRWRGGVANAGALILFGLGGLTFAGEIVRDLDRRGLPSLDLSWSEPILARVRPLRSVNGYGLFRVMTQERPELVVEASIDRVNWVEWHLRWKPGPPSRRPGLVAPHQPRLDWQFWFAALDPRGDSYWWSRLLIGLLEGEPAVTALMGESPFPSGRPRYLRLAYYDYRYTSPAERAETGDWWHRELIDYLTGPISLADLR
ncbi:MAG: lipase maturation factor family protein [Acidobacteria bacterium]|nr:lipase maturation factor family protein [Acidobacteriota bacterium]